jgi:uncharacterized protein (DUF1684 family)
MRAALAVLFLAGLLAGAPNSYEQSIDSWRKNRENALKAKDGWLTVIGLFWLKEGENRAGSDPTYEIVLPPVRSPKRIGVFDFHKGRVSFRLASGAHVTVNGKPIITANLRSDADGGPDLLQIGDFTMFPIKRGNRYAIRLRDQHSSMRREFTGLRWYPIKEEYRVVAKWVPYTRPQRISVPNVLGETGNELSPGYAVFNLRGRSYRLDPILEGNRLFFIFRDGTASKSTYGAGRFLYSDLPKEGKVVLDFNKAYNPPCAFTPFATCPLPPKQNRLAVAIEAGELKYGEH